MTRPLWSSPNGRGHLYRGDCVAVLAELPPESVDVVFADPPYFLSNGGTTCRGGQRVAVDKGAWDRSQGVDADHAFNHRWLAACYRVLKPDGSIWVSGTMHSIYSVGYAMQQQGYRLLNEVTWEKPNPPPNLGRRTFTHSTETLLWAARNRKSRYHFAYEKLRAENGGKQVKTVWRMPPPAVDEKVHGHHPAQKPEGLLERVLAATCPAGGVVLDPFNGSGTTGVVALRLGCSFIGVELADEYLDLARARMLYQVQPGDTLVPLRPQLPGPGRRQE